MEWLEAILEGLDNKASLLEAIKKELPKNFIPKSEFNSKNDELKATKAKMDELQANLEKLSTSSEEAEKLKEQLTGLKNEYETFKQESEGRVVAIQKKQAIERNLVKANANPDTVDLLMSQFELEKIQLDSKGDIVDWDIHIQPIKESRKSLFGEISVTGTKPSTGSNVDKLTILQQQLKSANKLEDKLAIKRQIQEIETQN
jgi:hypothetical protein